ncbi:MAG: hypothetical protein ABIR79_17905 [Candidatus Binatia bacterium]
MPLILVALTLFALVLVMAHLRKRTAIAGWIGSLVLALWILPGPAKIAAPLAVILTLALTESVASLRPSLGDDDR